MSRYLDSKELLDEVWREYDRAIMKYGNFKSLHEGYAIFLEEVDELWTEIKKKNRDPKKLHDECIQVTAMALKFLMFLNDDKVVIE